MIAATEIAGIDINLVSPDRELHKLLHELLVEIPQPSWSLSVVRAEEIEREADLWLWDFEPGTALPERIGCSQSRHLFLVHRKHLAEFSAAMGHAGTNIILKPVTRATLKTSVELAIAGHRERVSATTSLRADRDELLQCLIQTSLRLQEYDQDRTTFLARAVHDFRAPLTAVGGYCGLLLEEPLGPLNESQREVLRRMQHSARRLSRMASAMFELSVGRQIKRRPNLRQNDIRECLGQALHEVMPFADDKRIAITADLPTCDYPLYFDAGQMEQVLINLLDNACKFTPKNGMIEIRGCGYFWERRSCKSSTALAAQRRLMQTQEPNAYRIDIQNSGAPIPTEHLRRIFEEYAYYNGNCDRSGGGLGLAIARMIMAQHDGHVWAENTTVGPRFSVVLPRQVAHENLNACN